MIWAQRRKIPVFLAVATLLPIGVLSWLTFRILQQDGDVERQRRRERVEVMAGRLALDIDRRLQELEETLARGSIGVQFRSFGIVGSDAFKPLYQPIGSADDPMAASYLAPAQAAEFQRHDLAEAAAAYRRLADSRVPQLRGAALIGLARVLHQRGDLSGALSAYASLQQLDTLTIGGQPAALIARQGRCKALEEAGGGDDLRRAAQDLALALNAGGWAIDRATFEVYREMLDQWHAPASPADRLAKTDAAVEQWAAWRRGDLPSRGRRLVRREQTAVLAVWSGGDEGPVTWFGTPSDIETLLGSLWRTQHLTVSLSDAEGQPLTGTPHATTLAGAIVLAPAETRLPFTLSVRGEGATDEDTRRRAVLLSGVTMAFALIVVAAYGLYRATTREMLLAREQTDFVSAVSHEFRTPLTSMRHLTDLLVSRGVTSDERRTQYYQLLAHETERLHRMVETLLSFGRIDGGGYAWQLEPSDAGELVDTIVGEFRREPLAAGRSLVCEITEGLPIRADREALSRALWNLLENAAKYSDAGTEIRVGAKRHGGTVHLGVGDHGVGVPSSEREKIFQKFVRGAEAKRAGVRGVGLGLALVKRIVEAHGGTVGVESEPGCGSTFTIVLPLEERAKRSATACPSVSPVSSAVER